MINGVDRTRLTIVPAIRLKTGLSRNWPGLVTTSAMPSGRPIKVDRTADAATIMAVCLSDSSKSPVSAGESRSNNMTDNLSMKIERRKIASDRSKISRTTLSYQRHDAQRLTADIVYAPMQYVRIYPETLHKRCNDRRMGGFTREYDTQNRIRPHHRRWQQPVRHFWRQVMSDNARQKRPGDRRFRKSK